MGKIIISTTDDVESKVIKHYGGKRWRRIVNFLRGVNGNDETLGKKFGEEYVCLRESNIPIHTHDMLKKGVLAEPPENQPCFLSVFSSSLFRFLPLNAGTGLDILSRMNT